MLTFTALVYPDPNKAGYYRGDVVGLLPAGHCSAKTLEELERQLKEFAQLYSVPIRIAQERLRVWTITLS